MYDNHAGVFLCDTSPFASAGIEYQDSTPVRVAARLRRELQADVEMVLGHYGEFKVLVDGNTVIDGGAVAFLGVLPGSQKIIEQVRNCLREVN